jgi:hypothetical protein
LFVTEATFLSRWPPNEELCQNLIDTLCARAIDLVTTFDLVTLFGLTKSVTKSEVDCTKNAEKREKRQQYNTTIQNDKHRNYR